MTVTLNLAVLVAICIGCVVLGVLVGWAFCRARRGVVSPARGFATTHAPRPPSTPSPAAPTRPDIPANQASVFRNPKGQWRWRVRAVNHRIIATSGESFHNRADAEESLYSLLTNTEVVEVP